MKYHFSITEQGSELPNTDITITAGNMYSDRLKALNIILYAVQSEIDKYRSILHAQSHALTDEVWDNDDDCPDFAA
jgi:hypothetical protein